MNRLIRTKLTGTDLLHLTGYFVTVAMLGFLAMARSLEGATLPSWVSITIFGIAGLVAHNVVFVLPTRGQTHAGYSHHHDSLVRSRSPPCVTCRPSHSLLLHFFTQKNGLMNCLFNVGQMALSLIAAACLGSAIGWAPGAELGAWALAILPIMVCVHEAVNYGLVAAAIALEHKEPFLPWFWRISYEDRSYAIPTIYAASTISALLIHYMGHEGTVVVLIGVFAMFAQSRLLKEYATKAEESRTDALTGLYNLRYLED